MGGPTEGQTTAYSYREDKLTINGEVPLRGPESVRMRVRGPKDAVKVQPAKAQRSWIPKEYEWGWSVQVWGYKSIVSRDHIIYVYI